MTLTLVAVAAALSAVAAASSPSVSVTRTVDTRLCPFPLHVTVKSRDQIDESSARVLRFRFVGPSTITLRNGATGRTATLDAPGPYSVDTRTGNVSFWGRQVWLWSIGRHVPFMSTVGKGRFLAPGSLLAPGNSRARVIDPCALVSSAPPSTQPVTTTAPWPLPTYTLSQIRYAGLTPVLGSVIRHDHAHLDVIVDGRRITVPAGIGLAEPVDRGPCPAGPATSGDCATGTGFFAEVAMSPLHTHTASGIIHVESDRLGRFTLGQFFDQWGVRLDASCVGGYCTGSGRELRVFVNGRRVGDPRNVALSNHQEIAVVYARPDGFGSVPSTYRGGWPG